MVFVAGGAGGGGGPSQFTREMERIVAEVPETVNALTGFDIRKGIASFMDPANNSATKGSIVQGAVEGVATSLTDRAIESGGMGRK